MENKKCEDCISRQAVKDMLTAEWTKYIPMELDMSLLFVLEKISELPSVTPKTVTDFADKCQECGKILNDKLQTGWIPVSEKLPEDGQSVLFCDIDNDIMVGYHVKGRPDTHFSQDGTFEDMKNVIAWMPLPTPYSESEVKE